jgi:hypothetical protein
MSIEVVAGIEGVLVGSRVAVLLEFKFDLSFVGRRVCSVPACQCVEKMQGCLVSHLAWEGTMDSFGSAKLH